MLTVGWRGDETEIEALQLLAKLYTDGQRYRDAFLIMRTALVVHPGSFTKRRIAIPGLFSLERPSPSRKALQQAGPVLKSSNAASHRCCSTIRY